MYADDGVHNRRFNRLLKSEYLLHARHRLTLHPPRVNPKTPPVRAMAVRAAVALHLARQCADTGRGNDPVAMPAIAAHGLRVTSLYMSCMAHPRRCHSL